MIKYVALLRGINVGGHNVKMERLRGLFEELGLYNVRSYINSGNIFFETDDSNREELASSIEQHLRSALGFEVPTFLRTVTELENVLLDEPFKDIQLTDDTRFCVVFTKEPIEGSIALPQQSSKNDMELVKTHPYEAFVVWRIINGRPPSGKFPANIIPPNNTTRFYHTLAKIVKAAKN